MTAQAVTQNTRANLLRRALQANGIFSGLSGVVFTLAPGPIAAFLGLNAPLILMGLGVMLILYAVSLLWAANQKPINRRLAIIAIDLDVAWVVTSYIILFTNWLPLTNPGWWAVATVADIVAIFAIVQYVGLRQLN